MANGLENVYQSSLDRLVNWRSNPQLPTASRPAQAPVPTSPPVMPELPPVVPDAPPPVLESQTQQVAEMPQFDMAPFQNLLSQIQQASSQPQVTTSTQHTQAARSPELERNFQETTARLNELAQGTREAYGGLQQGFGNIIRERQNQAQMQASRVPAAVSSAAFASGLTPLEASQAGEAERRAILQQLFPQIAQLQLEQAGVPVQAQQALAGLEQPYQNLTALMSPYHQAIAGTTTTGETTQPVDPLEVIRTTNDIYQGMSAIQQGWEQTRQQAQQLDFQRAQIQIDAQLQRDRMAIDTWRIQQEQAGADRRQTEQLAAQAELQSQALAAEAQQASEQQSFLTGERLGEQQFAGEQGEIGREFQQGQTQQAMDFEAQQRAEAFRQEAEQARANWERQFGGPAPDVWSEIFAEAAQFFEQGEAAEPQAQQEVAGAST